MMGEHTVSNMLASQVLPHPNDAILFVGYSDPDSPAGKIKATAHGDLVKLREKDGQALPLRCRIENFDFSGHATRDALIDYAVALAPRTILLVHGDAEALAQTQKTLQERLPQSQIFIPQPGKSYRLD